MEGNTEINLNIDSEDYTTRRLDKCGVCQLKYNVGDRIPRILVNCGHTYCTACLTKYYRKNRIRCPFCKKLVKNLESVEQLPLNICVFSEIVSRDQRLLMILDPDSKISYASTCNQHPEKGNHFYCSIHEKNFCRECIKVNHRDDNCCVVDLFDINKLFQLNEENIYKNSLIVKARNKKAKAMEEFFIANS
jgi:hypothetical protein